MRSKELDMAPIWDDITTLTASELLSCDIDIIYGGFPCQDISVAGTGKGLDSERSGLYFEIYRLAKETKPKFIFLENVPAIRTRGLDKVVNSLTDLGYDCRWTVVSAAEVGAVHIRKRWFLLAYANSKRLREEQRQKLEGPREVERPLVIDGKSSPRESSTPFPGEVKSAMVRAGDGIPFIVDRNRALGNAVVPRQAREAFMRLIGSREGTATSD
jgi:DNA (cytosine-5)-methyltransferase 1